MNRARSSSRDAAESLAIQALAYIAGEPEELGRFLALSGIGPDQIRMAARESHFLAGVLDHMLGDERLLVSFAASIGIEPAAIARARGAFGDIPERDIP